MKRTQIWIVVTLMSLALIGLVSFQLYWINSAIKINTQRFKSDVQVSLQRVANKLELHHLANHVNSFVNIEGDSGIFLIRSSALEPTFEQGTVRKFAFTDSVNNVTVSASAKFRLESPDGGIKVDTARNIKIRSKSDVVELLITQMENREFNYWIPQKHVVDSLLHSELDERGIDIKYNFAVFQQKPDSLLFASIPTSFEKVSKYEYQASLNPSDLLGNLNYLTVNFPNQSQFLFKQIWVTLVSSVVLLLTIVFCFGYALQTIIRQKKLSEIKNDFINNMTHEFKTPVATISLASEALREPEVHGNEPTMFRYLDIIREENARLGTQVEKVLQSATLDRGDYKLTLDNVDLVPLLDQVISTFLINLEKRQGKITLKNELNSAVVSVDEHHILSCLNNLVDNAIKYSPEAPDIQLELEIVESYYLINVVDKGIGLSNDAVKRVFDKFYRVPTGNLHDVKGFGLGLSYVKSIVEMHQGKVKVSSNLGHGSIFSVYLPLNEH